MWEYTHYDELYHYGVPGMRWGRRKIKKWATSKNQPSSTRSSVLAGIYAATGSKKVGKALDRSNERDANHWKQSKQIYKKQKTSDTKFGVSKKAVKIGAVATATALAAYGGYKVNDLLNSATYTINGKQVSRKEFSSTVSSVIRSLK